MLTDDYYWYWLCNIAGIGQHKMKLLLDKFGTAKDIYKATADDYSKIDGISEKDSLKIADSKRETLQYNEFTKLEKKGIKFIHINHKDYPKKLKNIYDAPVGLYYRGKLPSDNKPSVAIVGARNCSSYGKAAAYKLAKDFTGLGFEVISGLALGIDTAAHKGALENGGYTCAVLASGVDICYPKSNIEMYMNMIETGCIISEYAPGTQPLAGQFPVRNRIISGLADVVVIVEARKRSGSLITADCALEQNRDVYAVPGKISDDLSCGCNELIKQGAGIMLDAADILQSLPQYYAKAADKKIKFIHNNDDCKACNIGHKQTFEICEKEKTLINSLATPKDIVYSVLDLCPKSIDIIIEETGLDIACVTEELLYLQLEGRIFEVSKNCYVRANID